MTPAEIHTRRQALGLTQGEAAALLRTQERAWRYWESGDREMPAYMALLLRALGEVRGFRRWAERANKQEARRCG